MPIPVVLSCILIIEEKMLIIVAVIFIFLLIYLLTKIKLKDGQHRALKVSIVKTA